MIHGHGRAGDHVFVIHIGRDADDPAGCAVDVDEFDYRIGPHNMAVHGILTGEHALSDALAHDDDLVTAAAIRIVEIAAGDDWNAEGGKESR